MTMIMLKMKRQIGREEIKTEKWTCKSMGNSDGEKE